MTGSNDRRLYEKWTNGSRHKDPVFGSNARQEKYEEAFGVRFVPFEELDDRLFLSVRVDPEAKLGRVCRYIPSRENKRACEVYPKCSVSGLSLPFVYS